MAAIGIAPMSMMARIPATPAGAPTRRTTFMPRPANPHRHDRNGGSPHGLITMRYGRTTGASAVTVGVNISGWAMNCSFRKTSWYLMGS